MKSPFILLVDMDNVIADLDGHLLHVWHERYPDLPTIAPSDRKDHWIGNHFSKEHDTMIRSLIREPGFFQDLPPISGAIAAVKELVASGIEVRICTSPASHHKTCMNEKCAWINKHFDEEFVNQLIISRDKSLIVGDVLIDDVPEMKKGLRKPTWKHVIFDAPYNREVKDKPRLNWENWKEVLAAFLAK